MKRFILAPLLLATPALAQHPAPAGQRAWEIMHNREVAEHQNDFGADFKFQDQTAALQIRDASGGEAFAFNDLTPYNPPNTR